MIALLTMACSVNYACYSHYYRNSDEAKKIQLHWQEIME